MTREETTKILMAMQTAYPAYKVQDKTQTIDLWTEMLSDLPYEVVSNALKVYIMTDTKGFAPAIGQLRTIACEPKDELTESAAWNMVYAALCNGIYHAEEEFNRLPDDVRRAVGGASQLREWATTDAESITVVESNFKRQYRATIDAKKKYAGLPAQFRPQIGVAPVATIEQKEDQAETASAVDADKLADILKKWHEELDT